MSTATPSAPFRATALTKVSLYRRLSLIGTSIVTFFAGRKVGSDAMGNIYYEQRRASQGSRPRRWVIYKDVYDASVVPAEWYGWLHYTQPAPISVEGPLQKPWQKPHEPNLTGSSSAYHPPGTQAAGGQRQKATGDYQPGHQTKKKQDEHETQRI